jgi:Winged helix-turn helix
MPIALRGDYDAEMVRAAARRSKDGPQARRLLALAAVYEGARRTEAAKIGGVTLQIIRDWVLKFNAHGPEGLIDRKPPGQPAERRTPRRARRDHRERPDPGGSWGRALAYRRSLPMDIRGIPRGCRQADVEPRIARHGLSQALGSSPPSCSGHRRDRRF